MAPSEEPGIVERIERELARSFYGPTWHGPTLFEAIQRVEPEVALWSPPGGVHSIAALTAHAVVWKQAVRRRLAGEGWSPQTPDENFPSVDGEAGWEECRLALKGAHEALAAQVAMESASRLDRMMPAGDGTAFDQILGVIQHDLYHAGQVVLLAKQASAL